MCPPGSPSCSRRARTWSRAVPDTTPRAPADDTARARCQSEMATPMPPWINAGWVVTGSVVFGVDTYAFTAGFVVQVQSRTRGGR